MNSVWDITGLGGKHPWLQSHSDLRQFLALYWNVREVLLALKFTFLLFINTNIHTEEYL